MNEKTYQNPILFGDYSDPDAIRVGEDYFMISSSFCNVPGIPLLHSKDLVNWQIVNYVLPKLPGKQYEEPRHGCGVWAPAIRYHEGTYFVCFPMPDEGIFMCTTKDPFGAWSEPVLIREGAGWIDPCPFWDEDGRAYLVAGVAKSRIGYKSVLHLVELAADGLSLIGEEKVVFDGNLNDQTTIEGPKLYKRNGYYYIFAPAGGVKNGWQSVLRSKNIEGPYEYRVVMRQKDTEINGPHQGAWVDTITGEDWFLHFQDVYAAGRIVHLQPMRWEEDWPIIGESLPSETCGKPVLTYRMPETKVAATPFPKMDMTDHFTKKELSLKWQWNANPKEGWYELTGKELRLYAAFARKELPFGDLPNLLLQKWTAPEFTCEYKLELSNLQDGNEAGVISMGMTYALLHIRRCGELLQFSFVKGVQTYGKIFAEHTDEEVMKLQTIGLSEGKEVVVKYAVRQTGRRKLHGGEESFPKEKVTISFRIGQKPFCEAGSYEAEPGRWVGTKQGVFCTGREEERRGFLTVLAVTDHAEKG